MKLIILSLLFSSSILAKDIQFNEIDKLNVITMEGLVSIRCQSGQYPASKIYQCLSSNIEGGNFQRLEILSNTSADRVYLKNQKTGIQKNSKIFKNTMKTKEINLWIETVTQRALLDYGVNKIEYDLRENNQSVVKGTYSITVEKSEQRRCPNGFLYYNNRQCPDRYSACRDYFYKYRYCK